MYLGSPRISVENIFDNSSNQVDLNGHAVMADILTAYTQRQLCAVELDESESESQPRNTELDSKLPTQEDLDEIPRVCRNIQVMYSVYRLCGNIVLQIRLLQKYDRETVLGQFTPFCRTVRTTKHPLSPVETQGWYASHTT